MKDTVEDLRVPHIRNVENGQQMTHWQAPGCCNAQLDDDGGDGIHGRVWLRGDRNECAFKTHRRLALP